MKVKKYVASTMKEALEKMKKDLGPEAVILGSRKVSRGGLLDFLGQEMVEVMATTEENVIPKAKQKTGPAKNTGSRFSVTVGDNGPVADPLAGDFRKILDSSPSGDADRPGPFSPRTADRNTVRESGSVHILQRELQDIKSAVGEMAEQIRYQRMPALPPSLKAIYKKLLDNELDEKISIELIQRLYARFGQEDYSRQSVLEKYLIDELSSMIRVAAPTPAGGASPLVIALVGPTGVGKTTTLAKLATNKNCYGNHKAAMITADTYRVAATQQLGTFSEIADIPMEIVYSPRDMTKALAKHKDKEVILIDTAARSHFSDQLIGELSALLDSAQPNEVHLLLSITTKPKDLLHAIERFRMGHPTRLLFTKFDETLSFGSIVSVVQRSGIPLGYLTFGPEVPEDIEVADPVKIARLVVKNVL